MPDALVLNAVQAEDTEVLLALPVLGVELHLPLTPHAQPVLGVVELQHVCDGDEVLHVAASHDVCRPVALQLGSGTANEDSVKVIMVVEKGVLRVPVADALEVAGPGESSVEPLPVDTAVLQLEDGNVARHSDALEAVPRVAVEVVEVLRHLHVGHGDVNVPAERDGRLGESGHSEDEVGWQLVLLVVLAADQLLAHVVGPAVGGVLSQAGGVHGADVEGVAGNVDLVCVLPGEADSNARDVRKAARPHGLEELAGNVNERRVRLEHQPHNLSQRGLVLHAGEPLGLPQRDDVGEHVGDDVVEVALLLRH